MSDGSGAPQAQEGGTAAPACRAGPGHWQWDLERGESTVSGGWGSTQGSQGLSGHSGQDQQQMPHLSALSDSGYGDVLVLDCREKWGKVECRLPRQRARPRGAHPDARSRVAMRRKGPPSVWQSTRSFPKGHSGRVSPRRARQGVPCKPGMACLSRPGPPGGSLGGLCAGS